jgi:hypothetical protein
VVGVLVGDQDGVEVTVVERGVGPGARVDEEAAVGRLDEQAGVTQVRDAHTVTV